MQTEAPHDRPLHDGQIRDLFERDRLLNTIEVALLHDQSLVGELAADAFKVSLGEWKAEYQPDRNQGYSDEGDEQGDAAGHQPVFAYVGIEFGSTKDLVLCHYGFHDSFEFISGVFD